MTYYTAEHTLSVLSEVGVRVVGDSDASWLCLCPFHGNSNTPALSVDKATGVFLCFNDACGARGNLATLVEQVTGKGVFASERLIARAGKNITVDYGQYINDLVEEKPMPTFSQQTILKMKEEFWQHTKAVDYMTGRGFDNKTLDRFDVGYSPKKNLIAVPMFDAMGKPVGVIGRGIDNKVFKNSVGLPKRQTLFNIHRAKKHPHIVITEASFDAMSVWQATGLDAVATLGSSFSTLVADQINKYATHVTIMTDDDQKLTVNENCRKCKDAGHKRCVGHNTGLQLGLAIAQACRGLEVSWAHLDSLKRYDGKKDAGDLTGEEIQYAIDYAVPHVEMMQSISAHSVV